MSATSVSDRSVRYDGSIHTQVWIDLKIIHGTRGLNHLMTLHVHNDWIDSVDLVEVANQFVSGNEYRQRMFGKF